MEWFCLFQDRTVDRVGLDAVSITDIITLLTLVRYIQGWHAHHAAAGQVCHDRINRLF
jgi:hypothetical protein